MLPNGTANHNAHVNGNGHITYLPCDSDYPPRPMIDITPRPAPKPAWDNHLAPVTWSMSYVDSTGISHSVTLRGNTEAEVLEMVKPLVAGYQGSQGKSEGSQP